MCARHPRGFRRLARFAPRVSEVLPGLRGPVYAHRLFACRTRIMAESPCQGKSDSTYGLINTITPVRRRPTRVAAAFVALAPWPLRERQRCHPSWPTEAPHSRIRTEAI